MAVVVRTGEELARVVEARPWHDLDPEQLHVAFLSGDPDPAKGAAIDHEALLPERVVVGVLSLHHFLGVSRSRGLGRLRLGVDATARNWRTVQALLDLTRRWSGVRARRARPNGRRGAAPWSASRGRRRAETSAGSYPGV